MEQNIKEVVSMISREKGQEAASGGAGEDPFAEDDTPAGEDGVELAGGGAGSSTGSSGRSSSMASWSLQTVRTSWMKPRRAAAVRNEKREVSQR